MFSGFYGIFIPFEFLFGRLTRWSDQTKCHIRFAFVLHVYPLEDEKIQVCCVNYDDRNTTKIDLILYVFLSPEASVSVRSIFTVSCTSAGVFVCEGEFSSRRQTALLQIITCFEMQKPKNATAFCQCHNMTIHAIPKGVYTKQTHSVCRMAFDISEAFIITTSPLVLVGRALCVTLYVCRISIISVQYKIFVQFPRAPLHSNKYVDGDAINYSAFAVVGHRRDIDENSPASRWRWAWRLGEQRL